MKTMLALPPDFETGHKLSLRERQTATLAALDSFMAQDESEHQETLRVLRQALNEDRTSQRSVFDERENSE